ncbi:globin domain-containing protein [Sulfurimonas sp. HSL-3221]|uniref:globin domain-containing protein n=1 Tax=Sulfurimonadaceae TaxID=2771471 RepID=UPI001E2831E2|nr:globin domain-containing protein [Sulfurimonas sp. HSL-3221]UFS63245.1 globin domain-containing protein [Sulfurimonas sp. HSL-3221]
MSLSKETIEIIKATAKPVAENAEAITARMYEILFEHYPETQALFKAASPDQHKKLAAAVGAYAANIEKPELLGEALEKMARMHVRAGVLPEHYPAVGVSLLTAVKEVLGDAATDEVLSAWREAYFFLGDLLIAREKALYAAA